MTNKGDTKLRKKNKRKYRKDLPKVRTRTQFIDKKGHSVGIVCYRMTHHLEYPFFGVLNVNDS